MPASPYFDGCYFITTYFDAAPCVVAGGGRPARGLPVRIFRSPEEPETLVDDEFWDWVT